MCNARDWLIGRPSASLIVLAASLSAFTIAGCERKERILDVETPAGDVEVDRNIDTGEVEVKVKEREDAERD
jgi:hypothetical protein